MIMRIMIEGKPHQPVSSPFTHLSLIAVNGVVCVVCGCTVVPPKIFSSAGVKNFTNIMSLLQQQTNKQTNKAIQLFSFVGAYPVGTTHVPSLSFNSRLCDIGARYCVASISKKSQF